MPNLNKKQPKPAESPFDKLMEKSREESAERVQQVHRLAKRIWGERLRTAAELQNRCLDAWDRLSSDLDTKIVPLIPVPEDRPVTNLIFGSGSFTTGDFQASQYEYVKGYAPKPPVLLNGIVTNRSAAHQCNARKVSEKHSIPLAELDFVDWYHEFIDEKEPNPIRATQYWFHKNDPRRPPMSELKRRFKIRQEQYHRALGEKIAALSSYPTDMASARGYSFQFCRDIFEHQRFAPHVNDTHPADLTYVNPATKEKLYPGWQSGPVQLMLNDHHKTFRGSLIEVNYMDTVSQIDELDEGALLAIGAGVTPDPPRSLSAKEIQEVIKIMDDYLFCTLEPTGLLLTWGVTEGALPIVYRDLKGNEVEVKQHLVIVGNSVHSGINAWGKDLKKNLKELEEFLFP